MNDNKDKIGDLIGLGIITASAIGTTTALIKAKYAKGKTLPEWYYGYITGYNTVPGDLYDVYIQKDDEIYLWARLRGIWFENECDYYKYLYDNLRWYGLPVGGSLIAIGHSLMAGVHALGRRAPMRGFNNWGVKAGWEWRRAGKPFWLGDTKEYNWELKKYVDVPGAKWRFYNSMYDAIDNFISILESYYPVAFEELFSLEPDINRYVYGLEHGLNGRRYATGAFNMREVIAWAVERVPRELNEHFGYVIK